MNDASKTISDDFSNGCDDAPTSPPEVPAGARKLFGLSGPVSPARPIAVGDASSTFKIIGELICTPWKHIGRNRHM